MGLHWTREQFLAGGALGAGLLTGNLLPMEWLTGHPASRWGLVAVIILWTLLMIIGAIRVHAFSSEEPLEFISALDVVHYLATDSTWGVMTAHDFVMQGSHPQDIPENMMLYSREEFSRGASSGNLRSSGLLSGTRQQIPVLYWCDALLDWDSIVRQGPIKTAVTQYSMFKGIAIYEDVRIAREDVLRIWPKPPWWWWAW